MHAIGFYHQHSASDRDEFVKIVWDNIADGRERNFNKYNEDTVSQFNVTYDYSSVMHYSSKAFSRNGENTIEPLVSLNEPSNCLDLSTSVILMSFFLFIRRQMIAQF